MAHSLEATHPTDRTECSVDDTYDVVVMGRSGVDVYPLQTGVGLEDVETFGKFLGGSATRMIAPGARPRPHLDEGRGREQDVRLNVLTNY